MTDSVVPAVIIGLVSGSVFVAAFAVQFYPPDNIVLFDEILPPLDIRHGSEILEIIENNATIAEHYKKKHLTVFHISDRYAAGDYCPFGSCARVLADSESGYLHVYVNYERGYVVTCFEQRLNTIYNCAGEPLG